MITKEAEELRDRLHNGQLPKFNEALRPNRVKKIQRKYISDKQRKAIKR